MDAQLVLFQSWSVGRCGEYTPTRVGGVTADACAMMRRRWNVKRAAAVGMALCALFLSGCVLSVNVALEGPDGLVAVVLSPEGGYDPFPEGGAIWVLDPEGYPVGDPFALAEGQHARVCDWSPDGSLLLVVLTDVDEDGFPIRWRVVELPVTGDPHEALVSEDLILSPRYLSSDTLVYLKAGDEQVSLCSLAIATGAEEVLHEDALAFLPAGEGAYVLGEDGAFRTLAGEEISIRVECPEESCQPSFLFFPELVLAMGGTGATWRSLLRRRRRFSSRRPSGCRPCTWWTLKRSEWTG